jgi:hypothetical protein
MVSTPEKLSVLILVHNSNFAGSFIFDLRLVSTPLVAISLPNPSGHLSQDLLPFCSDPLLVESPPDPLSDSSHQAAPEISNLMSP